jgi:hypothetical protein
MALRFPEEDREHLVVKVEDNRELVKFTYLSMMEWTERRRMESALLWKVRMTENWWGFPTCPWWSEQNGEGWRAPCCERWGWQRIGEVSLPVHNGVDAAEEDADRLVVEGEDDRELVRFPYLSMIEWTEQRRTGSASLWTVRITKDCEVSTLPVHDGVNRAEKDGERLVVEGEDDRG